MARIEARNKPRRWPHAELPSSADLTIQVVGLFSFCFLDGLNSTDPDFKKCEIGIFSQDERHRFQLEITGGACTGGQNRYEYTSTELQALAREKFNIEVVGPGASTDAAFYQPQETFNRGTTTDDEDFRWLLDVESPDLYDNRPTRNKQPHYAPKILVKNGTFFTEDKIPKLFRFVERDPGADIYVLGGVAAVTSARILLASAMQSVRFTFKAPNGDPKECTFNKGGSANILISNICSESGRPCTDSDFHLHFGTFDPPSGRLKADLYLDRGSSPLPNKSARSSALGIKMSEEAPCHAMGYGETGTGTPP